MAPRRKKRGAGSVLRIERSNSACSDATVSLVTDSRKRHQPGGAASTRLTRHAAKRKAQLGGDTDAYDSSASEDEELVEVEVAGDEGPSRAAPDYALEIYRHLRELEEDAAVYYNYLGSQTEINPQMRAILVDWLVETTGEYRLSDETLHLCVHYLDRFLSRTPIHRTRLQLVGLTCLFVAAKFEETNPMAAEELVHLSDGAYKKDEFLRMEAALLGKLDFSLSAGTSRAFLKSYQAVAPLETEASADAVEHYHCLANYLIELTLQEADCLRWLPSMIAAAAICLARMSLSVQPFWPAQLQAFSQYDTSAVWACLVDLHALHRKTTVTNLHAVFHKYASSARCKVANVSPMDTLPQLIA